MWVVVGLGLPTTLPFSRRAEAVVLWPQETWVQAVSHVHDPQLCEPRPGAQRVPPQCGLTPGASEACGSVHSGAHGGLAWLFRGQQCGPPALKTAPQGGDLERLSSWS